MHCHCVTLFEHCSYFANLAESIATHPEQKHDEFRDEKLKKILPDFLWLSRDTFQKNEDVDSREEISATEYMMKYILVRSDKATPTRHDMVVNALTTLFPSIHCKQIPPPGANPLEVQVGEKSVKNEDFDQAISESIDFILNSIKPKLGGNDRCLNGAILADLAREYCNAMNKPNSVPNIELSWISASESVLEKFAAKLVDDYDERMQKILNDQLPVEEGPISKKEKLLPLEDFNGKIVAPPAVTIQSAHQFSFSMIYHCLKEKILFYMPRTSQASDFDQRYKKMLDDFKMKIVAFENNDKGITVKGGLLLKFIKENYTSSKTQCERIFEMIYNDQLSSDKINLWQLGQEYNMKALMCGPAKGEVYDSKLKVIPGAPQHLTYEIVCESESVSLIVLWRKPLMNHQAVTNYQVQVSCNKFTKNDSKVLSIPQTETKSKIENAICNAIYSVKVCSFNGNVKGECSDPVEVRTPPGRPCKPQKPKIILETATRAIATISSLSEEEENGSRVKEIKVIIGINENEQRKWKEYQCLVLDRKNEHQCQIDIPDTEGYSKNSFVAVQVQMFNDAGGSNLSESENIPIGNLIPGPPQNLQARSTARDITVTWKAGFPHSAAATYYLVEIKVPGGSYMTKNHMYNEFSYTFPDCKPASTYFIRIGTGNSSHPPSEMSKKEIEISTLPDRPSRPRPPSIQIDEQLRSSRKAWLVSAKLHKEEENGSSVKEVIVQQRSNNQGQWDMQSFKVEPAVVCDIRKEINLLKATLKTKVIHFQTIMKNEYGESDPSDVYTLDPSVMIPGPPSDLSAAASFSSVKLTWKKPQENPASVDIYCIEMSSGDRWHYNTKVSYEDLTVTVDSLLPNSEYHFRAYAKNKDNCRLLEVYSNVVTVNTKACEPKKPEGRGISLDIESFDKANLTLLKPRFEDSGSDITMVQVMQFNDKKLNLNQQSVHRVSQEDLRNESDSLYLSINIDSCTHFIQVILENEVGKSKPSDFVGVAASSIIPGVPQDFGYVDQERRARRLVLKWKPPDKNERAAKRYQVEMKVCDELVEGAESRWRPTEFQHETKQNEHFAVISDLVPCTKYTFQMCAINNEVKGKYTENIEVVTTGNRPDNPSKPYVLQSDTRPDKAIATIHMLEKEKENGGPVTEVTVEVSENLRHWQQYAFDINAINHQQVEVSLPNLRIINAENNQFFFRVKMRNRFGESGLSENASLPFSVLRPGKVLEFEATSETAHVIMLRWRPPEIHSALVSNYVIYKTSDENPAIWREEMIVDARQNMEDAFTASIAEPRMRVERRFRVLTKNRDVDGLGSEVTVDVPDIVPGTPVNLREDKIQPRRVKVRWQQPIVNKEAVSQYKIEVLSEKTDAAIGVPLLTKNLSKVLTNLDPLTQYKVKVTAVNVSEEESPSAETLVKTVMSDGWRLFFNGITAGQAARRPDPDCDFVSSDDEEP